MSIPLNLDPGSSAANAIEVESHLKSAQLPPEIAPNLEWDPQLKTQIPADTEDLDLGQEMQEDIVNYDGLSASEPLEGSCESEQSVQDIV